MDVKRCRQCGEVKPIEQFRPYYGSSGTYTICRSCEKINSRVKYLERKGNTATDADKAELTKLYQLYELQRACGLKPPKRNKILQSRYDELNAMLDVYAKKASELPAELQEWLNAKLTLEPEYYLDEIYEQLKKKYRPMTGICTDTKLPVYDDRYAQVLDQILERFNNYEDQYYGGNKNGSN